MKKFILKSLTILIIFIIIGNGISIAFRYSLKNSSFFKPSFLLNNFKTTNTFNYFILGSSRGLTTIDTKQLDSELNMSGINLSMDDTDLKTHLLMLKHFYSSGYNSEYCILTLDESNFNKSDIKLGDNDYKFAPYIQKKYVQEHFLNYEKIALKPIYFSQYLPLLCFSYYNLQLIPASIISFTKPKYRHRFDEKGNYTYPISNHQTNSKKVRNIKKTITNSLIKQIEKITSTNNTKLIIYVAPYKNLSLAINSSYTVINHSSIIENETYFYDPIHVNSKGRIIATSKFSESFKLNIKKEY